MQAFKELSPTDRWRVQRFLIRGEAPQDPRLAAAAVELAESQQRRGYVKWFHWLAPVVGVAAALAAISSAVSGEPLETVVLGLVALTNLGQQALNPATRPKSVARSLEASRRVLAQGGGEPLPIPTID